MKSLRKESKREVRRRRAREEKMREGGEEMSRDSARRCGKRGVGRSREVNQGSRSDQRGHWDVERLMFWDP